MSPKPQNYKDTPIFRAAKNINDPNLKIAKVHPFSGPQKRLFRIVRQAVTDEQILETNVGRIDGCVFNCPAALYWSIIFNI
jgi:hypothetical protein